MNRLLLGGLALALVTAASCDGGVDAFDILQPSCVEVTSVATPTISGAQVCVNPQVCETLRAARVHETDHRRAVDLLFIAEAYRSDELPVFREHVDELVRQMAADSDSVVGRAWPNVNVYRLDLPSSGSNVRNTDPNDTALGGCLAVDGLNPGATPLLSAMGTQIDRLPELVPWVDATVIVMNTRSGRAHAGTTIFLNTSNDGFVLSHELAHTLLGLGDEYSDLDGAYPSTLVITPPSAEGPVANLSTDPNTTKWRHLVTSSPKEGGARYARGIWHPTSSCRMADSGARFCPICSSVADRYIASLRLENDGGPRCFLETAGPVRVLSAPTFARLNCRDADGIGNIQVFVDGSTRAQFQRPPQPPALHEVTSVWLWLGDEPAGAHTVSWQAADRQGVTIETELDFTVLR